MGKPKITWTNDMTETLLSVRKTALAKKEKGDGRALMNIVLEHWQELFPNSKVTVNALKIKLSKLTRGAEGKVPTATETAANNDKPIETKQEEQEKVMDNKLSIPVVETEVTEPEQVKQKLRARAKISNPHPFRHSNKGSTKLSASMKLDLTNSYKLVKEREKGKGKSKRYLFQEARKIWLQLYPSSSIALRTISRICKSPMKPKKVSSHPPDLGDSDGPQFCNVPDCTGRLKGMRQASSELASQPIFKYICYNCGRLIPYSKHRNHVNYVTFDPLGIGYETPPVLDLYDTIGELAYQNNRGRWTSCRTCKSGPIELYNAADPGTGKLYVPEPLRDLVSPYEKGQISLAGIISKIVKPRSDRFKVWEHFQGDVITRSKYDSHYYGMYGFMVKRDESVSETNVIANEVQLRIKRALVWLRNNNPLFQSFYANYDTLYRFDPDKVLHLHKATDFAANFNKTVDSHMHDESSGIVTNLDDCGIPNFLNEGADQAGIQHPIAAQMNKSLHELKQLTRVNYSDPKLEAKLWPHLFPFGIGGWSQDTCMKAGEYLKHVLLNKDARWRKDPSFSFHWYDRQIKMKLFYIAKARKAKRVDRVDALTSLQLHESTFYDKLGQIVPATITGSRSYWNSKTLDLLALSRKLGQPTFFVTLTQNDNWPEIQNHIINGPGHVQPMIDVDSEYELRDIHPSREYSVETVTAYSNRLKLFKEKVINNSNGPLGKVIDWWDRKEFQGRGAIHNHMVVWCDEKTIPDHVVCAEIPRGSELNPTVNSLKSFVRRLQVHRCRKDKCFTSSHGKPLRKCKYGFPYPVQEEERLNNAGNRFLPRRRCHEDILVVPYNQEILYLWGAHMNIQKVTASGWEMYLAKYVAKSEPSFQLEVSKDASDTEKYIRTRVVGRLEVDHNNLGHFLCSSNREVIYLPTDLEPVYGFVKRKKDLPCNPDSDDIFYSNLLDKYMERPQQLENVLYVDWAEKYLLDRSNNSRRSNLQQDDDNSDEEDTSDVRPAVLVDRMGRRWKQRKVEAVARWRFYLPNGENQENYYMQKLVLNLPLRKETPVISPNNVSKTYMEECAIRNLIEEQDDAMTALQDARQRGFSLARLRKMAQSLRDMDWIGEDEFNTFIDEVTTAHRADAVEDEEEVTDADFNPDHADLGNLRVNDNRIDLPEFEQTLSPSQRLAYDYITQFLSTGKQLLTAIVGEAGTGKSYLLKGIMEHATSVLHLNARKLATTGAAAYLIGGETVHHFFKMNIEAKSRLETGTIEYELVSNTNVLIIDEFSLLELTPFLVIDKILRDMAPTINQQHMPFGGKHIILMGDPAQLPAIERDIFDSFLWRKFSIVMLKDIKRQDDETFQHMLSTIRLGKTNSEIDHILRSKVVSIDDIDAIDLSNAAIICSFRRERNHWNSIFLDKLDTEPFTFDATDSDVTGNPLSEAVRKKIRSYHKERLEDTLALKVGARVVLTKNIDVEHGWLNGTIANVVSIRQNYITIENVKTGRKTVVTRMKQSLSFPGSAVQYVRTQFPLLLGWALTVHKVQGMTLEKAYILLNKNFFASGQAYVALSRVKSLDNLHLLDYDPGAVLLKPFYRDLLEWMKRKDEIRVDRDGDSSVEPEYPMRPPESPKDKKNSKRPWKKMDRHPPVPPKKPKTCNAGQKEPAEQSTSSRPPSKTKKSKKGNEGTRERQISEIFGDHHNLQALWNAINFPLHASVDTYLQYSAQFDAIIDILRGIDVLMYIDLPYRPIDYQQQVLLHPVLQGYLRAVKTVGDGSCLFYSIWKQLFPHRETIDIAKFMRQITLYTFTRMSNISDSCNINSALNAHTRNM
ncbi:uncharacterized protein LOC135685854 isoform X1 [Rhopilema esculentum]|uniref:uncharacterized protein LOC135685854 isoform X1 n=1 Tax=Rhopilema esculentum TaxID=499914 RepID=UPI0031E042AD